jgi:CHAT domain-containing protein/Flp pilus assembly protein TadD
MPSLCKTLSLVASTLILLLGTCAQAVQTSPQSASAQTSSRGVIVESVTAEFEAEKLGIKPGDVIDSWSGAAEHGAIDSPFDLTWVELEQKPRGLLSLEGLHGAERKNWKFSTDVFGLKVRPMMPEEMAVIYSQGKALAEAGKLAEAAELWRKAARSTTDRDPKFLASWLLMRAAESLSKAQRGKEADVFYEEAVQRCPKEESRATAQLFMLWGASARETADADKSEALFTSALEQSTHTEARSLLAAKALEGIALSAYFRDEPVRAREYLTRSMEMRQALAPGSSAVAASFLWFGAVDTKLGDLSAAQGLMEKASEIDSRKAPLSPEMAEISNILGMLAEERGDLEHAESFTWQTLSIGERLGRPKGGTAAMLVNLGAISQARGDFTAAERYLRESLSIMNEIDPESPVVAAAHNNLGSVLVDENKLDEGQEHLQRALTLKMKRGANNIRVSSTLAELGRLEFRRGDLNKAADYLERALAIQRLAAPDSIRVAETLADLAATKLKAGDLAGAETSYTQASKIRQKLAPESSGYGEVLAGLASIQLRHGKTDEASTLYGKAIAVLEGQMSQLGGGSEARSIFRVKNANYYRDYVALLIEQGNADVALDFLERSRARTLLELLDAAHADIRKGVDSALLDQQRSLRTDINAKRDRRISLLGEKQSDVPLKTVDKEISDLVKQYEDLDAKIRTASPEYAALTQPQPLTAQQIRNDLLDRDTVLLEYSLGEERSYVFAVTPESTLTFRLQGRAEIQQAAQHLYQLLSAHSARIKSDKTNRQTATREQKELERASANLSDLVLKPIATQLTAKRIVVVADGALQNVPFAMLPEPAAAGRAAGPAVPLIVNHEVLNLPSASVLAVLRRQESVRTRPAKTVAILADPVFTKDDPRVRSKAASPEPASQKTSMSATLSSSEKDSFSSDLLTRSASELGLTRGGTTHFSRLLHTRQEAEGIRAAFPASDSMAALDFNANRSTAVSPDLAQYRIVHFATHGLINSEHPELSGLVFSLVDQNGKQQDGFLQLKDIYNLNLPADLVVLSACETGLGKEINGEGLIGLTRGFMYAGSTRVVASLWNVSDVATARLMTNFYAAMEKEKLPPAAALRSAQVAMWKQKRWSSPYFWAAFQIQGDWK